MPPKKRGTAKPKVTQVEMGTHMGSLVGLAADRYPSLLATLLEIIQNAIDAGARNIAVLADQQAEHVAVYDNGSGITAEKFNEALSSVGESVKVRKPGVLGRFGLGLVSPITKCEEMLVISQPDPAGPTMRWTFRIADIRPLRKVTIPRDEDLNGLPVPKSPFANITKEAQTASATPDIVWRTVVVMNHVIKDRVITAINLDELVELIQTKLGGGMAAKSTTVLIKLRERNGKVQTRHVKPREYTGFALEEYVVQDEDAGEVVFKLYRAPRGDDGERRGIVKFTQTGAADAISLREFRPQAYSAAKNDPVIVRAFQALDSGYFEGEVAAARVDLVQDRDKFVFNASVYGLVGAISEWYTLVGEDLMTEEREVQADERYRRLGDQTLKSVYESFRASPRLSQFYDELASIPGLPREKRTRSTAEQEPAQPDTNTPRERRTVVEPPTIERESTGGSKRRQAAALPTLVYEIGDERLWTYDHVSFQVRINVTHPLWVLLDETDERHLAKNDRYILAFQKWLLIELLRALADDPGMEHFEEATARIVDRQEAIIRIMIVQ